MARMAELAKVMQAQVVTSGPPPEDELDTLSRLPQHSSHSEYKYGEDDLTRPRENIPPGGIQRRGPANVTSQRIDNEDKDWEKKL